MPPRPGVMPVVPLRPVVPLSWPTPIKLRVFALAPMMLPCPAWPPIPMELLVPKGLCPNPPVDDMPPIEPPIPPMPPMPPMPPIDIPPMEPPMPPMPPIDIPPMEPPIPPMPPMLEPKLEPIERLPNAPDDVPPSCPQASEGPHTKLASTIADTEKLNRMIGSPCRLSRGFRASPLVVSYIFNGKSSNLMAGPYHRAEGLAPLAQPRP